MVTTIVRMRGRAFVAAVLLSFAGVPPGGAGEPPPCDGTFHRAHFQKGPNALHAIDFSAAEDGWAVGFEYDSEEGGPEYPLVVHYNGEDWTEVGGPGRQARGDVDLRAVSALSHDQVWVSAARWIDNRMHAYIRLWDGERWRHTGHPDPGEEAYVVDVAALSETDVWAMGFMWRDRRPLGLALHYDGGSWQRVPIDRGVMDVDGGVDGSAWAVGVHRIWRYKAGAWRDIRPPDYFDTRKTVSFHKVNVVDEDDVWVLAYRERRKGPPWVAAHWNGSNWDITRMPDMHGDEVYYDLDGAGNHLWAVGSQNPAGKHEALAARWNGNRWRRVTVTSGRGLEGGVAVPAVGDAWALSYSSLFHACAPPP